MNKKELIKKLSAYGFTKETELTKDEYNNADANSLDTFLEEVIAKDTYSEKIETKYVLYEIIKEKKDYEMINSMIGLSVTAGSLSRENAKKLQMIYKKDI